ncbi:MAG: hypothetical protein ACXU8U_01270 [Asticcacaulis sp.]
MWKRKDNSDPSVSRRDAGLTGMGLALLLALPLTFAGMAGAASADPFLVHDNTAARVSSTIRPCFGMLLGPEMHTCGARHYREGGYRYGYYGSRYDASVDCDRAHPGYIEDVVRHIRPGGVLYLHARNTSCHVSLDIRQSITIIGEGFGDHQLPAIVAPDGEPCLNISPSADHVVLKNLYISSPRSDQASCVEAAGSEVTLQNTQIRYQGDAAAVHVSRGRLNLTENSHLIAKTRSAALAVVNSRLFAENSEIATTSSGIYAVLSGDSQIQGVSIQQLADWHGFERGENAIGLEIKLDSADSILSMNDMKVQYFATGVTIDGAGEALMAHSLIARSDHGVTSSTKRVRLIENTIIASEIGIDIEDGTAYIGRNQIANVHTSGILASSDGEIRAVDNEVDPSGEGCPTLKWGRIEPSQRICKPWFKGSAFDVPGDASDQYMFDQYWPRMVPAIFPGGRSPLAPDGRPVGPPPPVHP